MRNKPGAMVGGLLHRGKTSSGMLGACAASAVFVGPAATIGVHRLPVPPRGDRAGSALVPPLWTLLSRCRRAAGRARRAGRSRDHLPLGAAVHPAADRRGTTLPTRNG